jgi:hypothetical protein
MRGIVARMKRTPTVSTPSVTVGEVFAMPHLRGRWGAAQVVYAQGRFAEVVVLDHLSESTPTLADVAATPLTRARYAHPVELARLNVMDAPPREVVSLGVRAPALPETPHAGMWGSWYSPAEEAYQEYWWRALPEAARAAWAANRTCSDVVELTYGGAASQHRASDTGLNIVIERESHKAWSTEVDDASALDWRVFDALPCLARVGVTGDHAGLVPWLATRPLVHTLSWTGISVESLDLSALSLTSLTLEARSPLTVKLPASLEELHLRVRDATPITFEASRDGAFLSLFVDVWNDDDLVAIGGLTHVRALSIRGFGTLDLSRLTGFFSARSLEFEGVPGRILRSDVLARFTELRCLTLKHCYDVDAERFPSPDAWRWLGDFSSWHLRRGDVNALRPRWKKSRLARFIRPVDDYQATAMLGLPSLGWTESLCKIRLTYSYAAAVKRLAKASSSIDVTKALRRFTADAKWASEERPFTASERVDVEAVWERLVDLARARLPEGELPSVEKTWNAVP